MGLSFEVYIVTFKEGISITHDPVRVVCDNR